VDRRELAAFLRSRRARVRPGPAAGPRRRTPGLRREEVARLAGISVDYYARLEQARGPRPSRQVLSALARALRLPEAERAHLHHLAGELPDPPGPSADVPAEALHLLDRLHDTPAFVIDAKHEILACNQTAAALLGDLARGSPDRRNVAWSLFVSESQALADPPVSAFADKCVARLRAAAARFPRDPGIHHLITRLRSASPEFERRWQELRVCVPPGPATRHISHPEAGELTLECEALELAEHGQRLIVYSAEPGSPSAAALRALAGR
jgi:transcriptional regulator with XRE-family HTH domain